MKEYLEAFITEFEYPQEAITVLLNSYDSLCSNKEIYTFINNSFIEYENNTIDWDKALEKLTSLTENTNVHKYTAHLIFFICMTKHTKVLYEKKGLPYSIFKDSFNDLKYKLIESEKRYGVWGTSCYTAWYTWFFTLERFALGRLQFEIKPFRGEKPYTAHGVTLNPEDPCLNIHIPSCGPLTPELVEDSFNRAHEFFRDKFPTEYTPIMCHSWLLFPEHLNMLSEKSNIVQLIKRFDHLFAGNYENYDIPFTILYNSPFNGDINSYSPDNSLKRGYIELVKQNKPCGYGCGVTLYKPQK